MRAGRPGSVEVLAVALLHLEFFCGSSYHEAIKAHLEEFVVDTQPTGMLNWAEWVADHVFDVQVRPDLMQHHAQIVARLRICEHDELHAGWCLIVVQLVFARAVGYEFVVFTAQLADHVAEREDDTEYQLGVICLCALVCA